jgi:beta-glucosidase-like glycosyl hydrolase/CubicO group peptidase (beta-lactamase class C family)
MGLLKIIIKKIYLWIIPAVLLAMNLATNTMPASITREEWVEIQFQQLTFEERIGQLFMVAAYSNKEGEQHQKHQALIENLIKQYNIGGLIFFQGDSISQAKLTNQYQSITKTPLLIAIDAEWGLGMRLRDAISYPRQMTLGAIQNNQLIYDMGAEIARQLKLLGIHINLAPVLDINIDPVSPINNRSFADSKGLVTSKGIAYIRGMQDNGILAVAKHFPGLGDTNKDSHLELPVILHDKARLENIELFPFQQAIAEGVAGVMVAHTYIPAYDKTMNRAVSLSPAVVTQLLKGQLGFQGLVFTDALNMKAVSKYYQPGEVELMALQAGHDILLFPEDVPKAIALIKEAIEKGTLDLIWIEQKVKKILATKYQVGLHEWKPIVLEGLGEKLHTPHAHLLKQRLFEEAITLVANQDQLVPISNLRKHKIASLSIVKRDIASVDPKATSPKQVSPVQNPPTVFSEYLAKYAPIKHYILNIAGLDNTTTLPSLAKELEQCSMVMVDLHNITGNRTNQFGLETELLQFLHNLQQTHIKVVLVVFGNTYCLELFPHMQHLIAAYQDDPVAEQVAAQMIWGALPMVGKLPINVPNAWKAEWGLKTTSFQRLGYTLPEAVQMDSKVLQTIDNIIEKAIEGEVMPGCQVLVARRGKIVLEKAYGYLTYTKEAPVTNTTLYDIASLTKVVGTLQALMYLTSTGKLLTKQKASFYLPELKGTDKKNLRIDYILAHQAGLVPYHHQSIKERVLQEDKRLNSTLFSAYPSATYSNQLGPQLYATPWLKDLIWDLCLHTRLKPKKWCRSYSYEYSCVGFFIMHKLVEKLVEQPMEVFLDDYFYQPMGLGYITYRPFQKFTLDNIAPTEECDYFRSSPIHGIVHDPKAAMYGGVAGNAGLFSNAHDLAVILQMNLQDGYYGGERYFRKGIVQQFTRQAFKKNRRGLGWDKPELSKEVNTSLNASHAAYGHLGFTGTAAWVDPKYGLIYIFLSNRTYPNQRNTKLITQKLRIKVQDVIYQALQDVTGKVSA